MGSKSKMPAARLTDVDTGHPPSPPTPVITGSANVLINSLPAARKGDMLVPHHPGIRTISEGSASVKINGMEAARITDSINCGGVLITGSANVLIGDNPVLVKPTPVKRLNIQFPNGRGGQSTTPSPAPPAENPTVAADIVTYTNKPHSNDTEVRTIPALAKTLDENKASAVQYWTDAELNAQSFPAALGARLMRLNAEAGYSTGEGLLSLAETLTDWDKFTATVAGVYNAATNPEKTYEALKQAALEFAELPAEQQGEAAYKMLIGGLAGSAAVKATGAVKGLAKVGDGVPKSTQPLGGRGPATQWNGFDESLAGGPVRDLNTNRIKITDRGIAVVEKHTSRFGSDEANQIMIDRLNQISRGDIPATQQDLNFYSHELREYVRYRKVGWETGVPLDADKATDLWRQAHSATLDDYNLPLQADELLYHPEALKVLYGD